MTVMLSGDMTWRINGESYTIHGGDVFLIKKDSNRSREPFSMADYISFNFYTDETIDLPMLITGCISSEIRILLSACDEIYKTDDERLETVSFIFSAIMMQLKINLNAKKLSPLVHTIKQYIEKHIHEVITLEKVASATFFSAVYCAAVFKREVGKSIIDYVIDEKVKLAKIYIFENRPLRYVAESLGYYDYNYFSRTFKKRTGITPTQYKNSLSS